jgi:hypothetical protein
LGSNFDGIGLLSFKKKEREILVMKIKKQFAKLEIFTWVKDTYSCLFSLSRRDIMQKYVRRRNNIKGFSGSS